MKNQGLKIALVIFGVFALGAGAYFIFKPKLDDKDDKDDKDEKDDKDDKEDDESISGIKDTNKRREIEMANFQKFVVNTNKGNLNMRDIPSTAGNIKQSLPKGVEILARPSQKDGWHEVSDDGKKVIGYVSSQYIIKK